MIKIALFGKLRSGKNTVAKFLVEKYGFKEYALGDGIGEIIDKYLPVSSGKKPRHYYQHIGQSMRELDSDVWLNYCLKKIEEDGEELVVITDCRQKNEEEELVKRGYIIVGVDSTMENRYRRALEKEDIFKPSMLFHETELAVDKISPHVVIENNSTMEELAHKTDLLVQLLRAGGEF